MKINSESTATGKYISTHANVEGSTWFLNTSTLSLGIQLMGVRHGRIYEFKDLAESDLLAIKTCCERYLAENTHDPR